MTDTEPALLAAVERMCADAAYRRRVLDFAVDIDAQRALARFNTAIHPGDQMLLHSLKQHRDAGAAFSQYFNIALQQHAAARQLMRAAFGADARDIDVLDFACGYGRLLRFLSLSIDPRRIWASDLQTDAVDFVRDAFGVQPLASHEDPSRFEPGRRFDFIWVASLFSHLPEPLFHAWLARLVALLTPRGVLCFSVRDASLLPDASTLPASGLAYARESENADLAGDIYGTAYASEAFVCDALRTATRDARAYVRLQRALANEQDLYVVAGDAARDLTPLRAFRRGPWGWVDVRRLSPDGTLDLQGWAASLDDGAVEAVEIDVAGELHALRPSIARPDVSAAFRDARLEDSGWAFGADLGGARSARVVASARTRRGERALLYAGEIGRADVQDGVIGYNRGPRSPAPP
ncbi:MAG TPA: class I SAM-dependent methyltransferase [Rhodanobacteraceae bacterium]|nr:class I SAM-dependent methyltransferase [Rhodanobacteraceae bacterium]